MTPGTITQRYKRQIYQFFQREKRRGEWRGGKRKREDRGEKRRKEENEERKHAIRNSG